MLGRRRFLRKGATRERQSDDGRKHGAAQHGHLLEAPSS
jgi:hypothetical protein